VIVFSDGQTVAGTTAEGMTAAIKEVQARQNGTSVVLFTVEESEHHLSTPPIRKNFVKQLLEADLRHGHLSFIDCNEIRAP
jgi:hypothetical protein